MEPWYKVRDKLEIEEQARICSQYSSIRGVSSTILISKQWKKSHWRLWFLKPQLLANDRVYHGSMKCGWNIFVRDPNNEQGENRLTDVVKKGIIEPSSADSVDKKNFSSLQLMYNSSPRNIKVWTELKLHDEFLYSRSNPSQHKSSISPQPAWQLKIIGHLCPF